MRRNETILVYGVTGLLFVILFVAVVFGNEGPTQALERDEGIPMAQAPEDSEERAKELSDLLNLEPAVELEDALDEKATEEEEAAAASGEGPGPNGEPADPEAKAAADEVPAEPAPALEPDPLVADHDGRVGNGQFREVTVQKGQSFSLIVLDKTGSLDNMELVKALNEDIDPSRLQPGRKLLVPYVEDDKLAEMRKERLVVSAKHEAERGKLYEVRAGDSLWKIAMQATGDRGQAPDFISKVMELNPALVPERLKVGQKIALPK